MTLPAGTRLGPYEISAQLGAGGMGEVYRARDRRLDRTVAIKVIPSHLSSDPVRRQRFEREARTISVLHHPNICTLYDIGHQDGTDYLVLEYLEGETLTARLAPGPLPLEKTLRYGIEIADALDAAHHRGIVHRDLKPGNVLITAHGESKVLDFGLAKLEEEESEPEAPTATRPELLTSPGVAVGTVAYMSPEQARGEMLDVRTDIFSLGSVLYEMATGKRPFSGKTSAMVFKAILDEVPPPLTSLNPALPQGLNAIIAKALEKDRELRYQSAKEIVVDLKHLQRASAASQVAATTVPVPAKPWILRRRVVGLGATILLVVAYSARWWFSKQGDTAVSALSRPVHVTTYPGAEEDATLSPDGRQVAFSGNVEADDNFDIYVKLIGAEPPLRLTRDPEPDEHPIWSPDGRWIAFTRNGKKVLLVSPLGGMERTIAEGNFVTCAWSADSQSVIVEARAPGEKEPFLAAISIASGEQKRIVGNANWPATVSHSGSKLAYASFAPEPRLYVAALSQQLDVSKTRQIDWVTQVQNILGCDWTENDRELVCALRMQGNDSPALWRINAESQSQPQILPFSEGASGPVISTASHRLVWDKFKADSNIWRALNPERGGKRPAGLFISSTEFDGLPEYSPDGSRIAFVSARSGQRELWVADANGSDLRMLTSMSNVEGGRWSPDGKSIVFAQKGKIHKVDSGGGIPREILLPPGIKATQPSYSHDGTWIYFACDSTGRSEVWRVSTVSGAVVQVTKNGGALPSESPDGHFLFYIKTDVSERTLYSQPPEGGREQRVFETSLRPPQFALAAGGLYYIRYDNWDHPIRIDFLDLRTGASRRVLTLNMPQRFNAPGLSVSPDGKWLLYALFDFEDDIMLFEGFQ